MGKTVRKSIDGTWLGKSSDLGMSIRSQKNQNYSHRSTWMTSKAGKKQHLARLWKKLMKDVDTEEPTSFHDHVYFGCT